MKPFRPLTVLGRAPSGNERRPSEPPAKRRRITQDEDEVSMDVEATKAAAQLLKKPQSRPGFVAPQRKPLASVQVPNSSQHVEAKSETGTSSYYTVLWRKFTLKKNKTWDGDGILSVSGTYARLQDISGKDLGKGVCKGPLLVGSELSIGGKDIEVESMISRDDYISGRVFLGQKSEPKPSSLKEIDGSSRVTIKAQAKQDKIAQSQKERLFLGPTGDKAAKASFKSPMLANTVQAAKKDTAEPTPRHDPKAEGALVMKRPPAKYVPKGKQVVDVVMDPLLTRSLREHQREGVSFLYDCVMGFKDYDGEGAILADEMGLGKTLQTIALLWTLLKQSPLHGDPPVIKKALIVCPVSLINNWRREIRKWLGTERVGIFVPENNKMRLTDFTRGRAYQIMIIGYEKLTKVQDQLQGDCGIDIVIADEGHRLKTAKNKAAAAIKSINTDRRVILSGTPIQNDLEEFFVMVDFVNPNIMSKYSTFKKEFENPIIKSRQPGATAADIEKGEARSEQLSEITTKFILRRTADILSKYLPPKTEYVVFCKPTSAQTLVYRKILESQAFQASLNSATSILELINVLRKVCNCPTLLHKKGEKGEITKAELLEDVPAKLLRERGASGKLQVLDSLLHEIKPTGEKVVLVSYYTSTLDILGTLLTSLGYNYLRLDGTVAQSKRQDLVDRFNRSPQSNSFVFLLSAKAGGVGLNLIGASRLILFDLDWNPATDLQAMARVHRDGQKRPCYIYRLITQGAMDEKIFQRQVSKTGLADSIVDGKANASSFTQAELRDLFRLDESDTCQTHQLMGCTCGGNGIAVGAPVESEDGDVSRNDLASLSVDFVEEIDGIEVVRLDGEEVATGAKNGATMRAIAKRDGEEAEIQSKARECRDAIGKAKMLSLMQYSHFDTSRVGDKIAANPEDIEDDEEKLPADRVETLENAIEDVALQQVLREPGRRVGFMFAKVSS